jgi:mevalonate kinase
LSCQVCERSEAKQAELNAQIQRLESHIHWLGQENEQLRAAAEAAEARGAAAAGGGGGGEGAAAAAAEAAAGELRTRVAAMESELRKSKRAEQKLQVCLGSLLLTVAASD